PRLRAAVHLTRRLVSVCAPAGRDRALPVDPQLAAVRAGAPRAAPDAPGGIPAPAPGHPELPQGAGSQRPDGDGRRLPARDPREDLALDLDPDGPAADPGAGLLLRGR